MRDVGVAYAKGGVGGCGREGDYRVGVMTMREEVEVSRNTEAIMIPSGEKVLVPKGAQATITQSLGGAYTLITDRGLMVRVSGDEVEAIGKAPQATAVAVE